VTAVGPVGQQVAVGPVGQQVAVGPVGQQVAVGPVGPVGPVSESDKKLPMVANQKLILLQQQQQQLKQQLHRSTDFTNMSFDETQVSPRHEVSPTQNHQRIKDTFFELPP
jgi:hypothetical protein